VERIDKDVNRAFYNEQRHDERRRFAEEPSKVHSARLLVPWVVSHLQTGARVVDIAGGAGAYASQIVRAAPVTVVGLDISESMIEQRGEDPLLTENIVGDMEALPFEDESFDAALFRRASTTFPTRYRRCAKRGGSSDRVAGSLRSSRPRFGRDVPAARRSRIISTSSACPAAGSPSEWV
jgi:Methyltransferase domain